MPSLSDLSLHLPGILLAYSVLIIGICSPGPAVLAIIGTALSRGRAPAVQFSLGVVCGSAFWGVAAAAGMTAILTAYANVLIVMKIAGGLYLMWLAWKALRSALAGGEGAAPESFARQMASPTRLWAGGFMLHLLNPKAVMAWLATIALAVTVSTPVWVSFVIVLGGIVISLVGNLAYALVFSTERMANLYRRAKRPIELMFAGFFGLAGAKLLSTH